MNGSQRKSVDSVQLAQGRSTIARQILQTSSPRQSNRREKGGTPAAPTPSQPPRDHSDGKGGVVPAKSTTKDPMRDPCELRETSQQARGPEGTHQAGGSRIERQLSPAFLVSSRMMRIRSGSPQGRTPTSAQVGQHKASSLSRWGRRQLKEICW